MSNSWTEEILEALAPRGRTLLVTLGTVERADDGAGPYLCARVRFTRPGLRLLDGGSAPAEIAQDAIDWKPDKIIVVDAADFGGAAGEVRVIPPESLNAASLSTHTFPPSLIFSVVREDTGAELVFVGVQVKSLAYRVGLSAEVEETSSKLVHFFNNIN